MAKPDDGRFSNRALTHEPSQEVQAYNLDWLSEK
jgi:hypothetical protein